MGLTGKSATVQGVGSARVYKEEKARDAINAVTL
jgi:hypothetical protein